MRRYTVALIFFVVSLTAMAQTAILPPHSEDRLVHPGSPLDVVMKSERNSIDYLEANPIDLTGLPPWLIFNATAFMKDKDIGPKTAPYNSSGREVLWNVTL